MALCKCKECGAQISTQAQTCPKCGFEILPVKSNFTAGCLGFLLGPVGLWYKGHWAAGFAWLILGTVIVVSTSGLVLPILWIGMGIHAIAVKPKR